MAFNNQAIVPSPPATSTVHVTFPSKRHHSKTATGSRSDKSTTCAGFNNLLNRDKISAPSLLPDLLLAENKFFKLNSDCQKIIFYTYNNNVIIYNYIIITLL